MDDLQRAIEMIQSADDIQRIIELVQSAQKLGANAFIQKEDLPLVESALLELKNYSAQKLHRAGRIAVGHFRLNEMNEAGKLDYSDYSNLFDIFSSCE